MLRTLWTCAIAGTIAAGVSAQTVQVTSGTLRVGTYPSGAPPTTKSAPVGPGLTTVGISRDAIATSIVGWPKVDLSCFATVPFPFYGSADAFGRFTVEYSTATPLAGTLRLTSLPQCLMLPVHIDVGVDGVFEIDQRTSGSVDVAVVLGPRPLAIELDGHTVSFPWYSCTSTMAVEFLPGIAQLDTVGTPCGPVLTAYSAGRGGAGRDIALRGDRVAAPLAVLAFGTVPQSWPLPCPLLTDIAVPLPVTPSSGLVDHALAVPPGLTGTFRVQLITIALGPLVVSTSNAVTISLP